MPPTPEAQARAVIDGLLAAAGWLVQDMADFNRRAAPGVAVGAFPLPSGPCDYLLFFAGKACGVIEAKKAGVTLSGVAEQATRYMRAVPPHLARWADTLVFDYESTGDETYFRDTRDPQPRPLAEIREICDTVDRRLSESRFVAEEVADRAPVVHALRRSILKAAFSGQLVPQDPRDEPASSLLARLAAQVAEAPAAPRRRGRPAGRRSSQPNAEVAD